MAMESITLASSSNIICVQIGDSTSTTGAGKTGLTYASSGLIISTRADVEPSATAYTAAGNTIETITTLGTYAAPTATKCRFKEVDSTNHPGLYEIQFADARMSVSNARKLYISVLCTGCVPVAGVIPLTRVDLQDSVRGGMTALPNAAADAAGGLPISDAGGLDMDGRLDAAVSSRMATYTQPTGFLAATFPTTVASTTNITAGTITTVTNLTNAPTNGDLTATMKSSVTTAATAATPIAASVSGNVGGNVVGSVGSVVGNVGGSVASVAAGGITSSSFATDAITAAAVSAGAVTKIQTGLATPTNITAGTITTVTNLTNAPTSGDFTATMKTSITTAATAATPTAAAVTGSVGSVAGNVAGNVVGSVGSVASGIPTAVQIRTEIDSNSTQLAAILEDTGTTLPAAIAGISAGSGPTAVEIRQEMDANSTKLAAILEDTGTTLQDAVDLLVPGSPVNVTVNQTEIQA